MPKKTMQTGLMSRAADVGAVDMEARTVEISFSSEIEVKRWFGQEILDHSPDSVRMGRLQNKAPFLMDHDSRDLVGVIETASIDADRKGRALIRFGNSDRASEILQDFHDEIRTKISVGYAVHEMVLDRKTDEEEFYRVTDWEPHELSAVSIPADDSVGVGRSSEPRFVRELADHSTTVITPEIKQKERKMPKKVTPTETPVDVTVVRAEAAADAAKAERIRINDITGMARKFEMNDAGDSAISEGMSADDFSRAVLDKMAKRTDDVATQLDLDENQTQRYSLMNAIRATVSGNWDKAKFERECSMEIAERLGRDARGFFVPFEVQNDMARVQTVGTATAGGNLVASDLLAGSFIEVLRANSLSGQLGVTYLPGLVGDVDIPRRTAGASFGWLAEDADGSLSDSAFDMVSMSPKTIAGATAMSRKTLKQTTPAIESLVRSDLAIGAGLAIDLAVFQGSGAAGQPTGIVNQSGVNTQSVTAAGNPTWAEIVGFETAIDSDNALGGALGYVTTPAVRGNLRTTAVDAGSGMFLADKIDYSLLTSTQLTAASIIFGNFSDVIVGMWGVMDLVPDTATKAASGGLVLRVFQDVDVAVRHPESFCINA